MTSGVYFRTSQMKKNIRNGLTGRKLSKEHKCNIALNNSRFWKGKHRSESTKIKMSLNSKSNPKYGMKGHHLSKEHREKIKINMIKRRRDIIIPTKDTTIEIKLQNFLRNLKIEFFTHKYMSIIHGYQCDIFVPRRNLVIECFGDYWHKYPIGREIDNSRCQELREKGFKVLVFWEREIRLMELEDFKNKLNI